MSDHRLTEQQLITKLDAVRVASLPDVDKLLISADQTLYHGRRSASVIGYAIAHILRNGPAIGLKYLEGRYRYFGSNTYLLAAPKKLAPPNVEPRSIRTGRLMPYHLWICVNGQREAEAMMGRFNITTSDENLARLNRTGMLCMKKPGGKS